MYRLVLLQEIDLVAAGNRRSPPRAGTVSCTSAQMGFGNVVSLRTGLRGWNDDEQPLYNTAGTRLDPEWVAELFRSRVSAAQLGPAGVTPRQVASA